MKIAIHLEKDSFSEGWVKYCDDSRIPYKIVNCYRNDIISQMADIDILLWHWNNADPRDALFARQLVYSLEAAGKKVFPDSRTCWHFDDKVGQKYLLETIKAPLVNSYVFYDKKDALAWIEHTEFPKVFKLRAGAGSYNVMLAKTKNDATRLVNKAFGSGFSPIPGYGADLKRKVKSVRSFSGLWGKLKRAPGIISDIFYTSKIMGKESGYAYFQDFIPDNTFDIRVVVIGDKAFALKRLCRENDFRASGSGKLIYDKAQIDERCIKIAFDVSGKLSFQCMSYDFVFSEGVPQIVEISYGFVYSAYEKCEGYWGKDMVWLDKKVNAPQMILEHLLSR